MKRNVTFNEQKDGNIIFTLNKGVGKNLLEEGATLTK